MTSFLGREAAQTASQVEDFGLPAILEKMNFLFTPLNSGPFWDISRKFQKFLIISQSSLQHENQWKLTLVPMAPNGSSAECFFQNSCLIDSLVGKLTFYHVSQTLANMPANIG